MKILKIILLCIATLVSCSKDDTEKKGSIVGAWQFVEFESGFPSTTSTIEDGFIYTFAEDGSFIASNLSEVCQNGSYTLAEIEDENGLAYNDLLITLDCDEFTEPLNHSYTFDDTKLFLTPLDDSCPENCVYILKKVITSE